MLQGDDPPCAAAAGQAGAAQQVRVWQLLTLQKGDVVRAAGLHHRCELLRPSPADPGCTSDPAAQQKVLLRCRRGGGSHGAAPRASVPFDL